MTMTLATITTMNPLRERAVASNLHDLAVYVPEAEDIDFEDDSYVFITRSRPSWRDLLDFTRHAERLLHGRVFVMHENALVDNTQASKAVTGAVPIQLAA